MPYSSINELPDHVKKLPEKKQRQFMHIVNQCLADGKPEARCFAMANGVTHKERIAAGEELGFEHDSDPAVLDLVEKVYGVGAKADESDVLLDTTPVVAEQSGGLIVRAMQSLGIRPTPSPVRRDSALKETLLVVKQADGGMRWYARYSNNFKDRDREIIPEAAHKEFVGWADTNHTYPELWVWHTPGTRFGTADWLDYSEGFTHASGLVDNTDAARSVVGSLRDKALGVSHGMLCSQQGNVITKYRSFEISVLPLERASVWTTAFNVADKETQMAFTPEKRAFLVSALGEDRVKALEGNTEAAVAALKQLGVEYKSADEQEAAKAETNSEGFKALSGQLAELTGIVKELAAAQVTQAASIKELQKPIDEQLDDAFLAKVASKVAAVRPTESKENVTTADEAKEKAAAAAGGGDFFKEMLEKSFGAFAELGNATPGSPAAGSVTIK